MNGVRGEAPLQNPSIRTLEALLFVATQPVPSASLAAVLGISSREVGRILSQLREHYEAGHGVTLIEVAGGWQMVTAPEEEEAVRAFRADHLDEKIRLSKASLETLAVVAYRQPVTRGEVEEIRGVRCDRVMETLLRHGLVRVAGRRRGSGTPLLFRTTDRFLELFGLQAIADLPALEELREALPEAFSEEGMA
ncbi:MAG TPA: SMC-Scp complex subunit ScpB [Synergistaceae bacterium]|nr:SMC-Scp complex subunit ScpB [Synergistaceae bacterium]HQH78134.1 SMC-Scp complex subunit ScpB [Synergistaceae bacterium]HQK24443.1 SMC-Scp complex subunit ScpB [Synergistaceae bacterium]